MRRFLAASSLVAALGACGSSHMNTNGSADAQALDSTAQSISNAANAYRTSSASMPDVAACAASENAYQTQVRPLVQRMHALAGAMDDRMSSMMGQTGSADMTCATDAMAAELDRHHAVACASPSDMLPNQAEADRHARWMIAWADHQRTRAGQVGSGSMQGGGMMGGSATTGVCQHGSDGSYTMMGGTPMQMPPMGVQGFHALSQQIADAAAAHGTAVAGMADVTACAPAETSYAAQVRPMIQQMRVLADDMDVMMGSLGQTAHADMTCSSDALLAELDHHASVACGSDLSAIRLEGARHAAAMASWADHQRVRSEEMGAMMGIAGMTMPSSGTGGACQRNPGGTFTAP